MFLKGGRDVKKLRVLLSALLAAVILLISVPTLTFAASDDAGSIDKCTYNEDSSTVTVSGSIDHKVMTQHKNGRLLLYRMRPWDDAKAIIAASEPLSSIPITIRFEIKADCSTTADRLSMYLVAVESESGEKLLIAEPRYIDVKSANVRSDGFKGVNTAENSLAYINNLE